MNNFEEEKLDKYYWKNYSKNMMIAYIKISISMFLVKLNLDVILEMNFF